MRYLVSRLSEYCEYIARGYKRWRHSRGYGVHSPFAYNLVDQVIRANRKYSYYGYEDIEDCLKKVPAQERKRLRHDARLVYRLMVFLKTYGLFISEDKYDIYTTIANRHVIAYGVIGKLEDPFFHPGDLYLIINNKYYPTAVDEALRRGAAVIAFDPTYCTRLNMLGLKKGLILEGKRVMISIPNPDMERTFYDMKF